VTSIRLPDLSSSRRSGARLAIDPLLQSIRRCPSACALRDAKESISYRELWQRAVMLAAALDRQNTPPVVVIHIPKSVPAVVGIVAAQLSGRVYVPFDVSTPPERRQLMLARLGPKAMLSFSSDQYCLDDEPLSLDNSGDLEGAGQRLLEALALRGSYEPLYVMFTSGSTGVPKGVTVSNASVVDYIDWNLEAYEFTDEEVIANGVPLFFDGSVLDLYISFAKGGSLHLLSKMQMRFPGDLIAYLEDHRVTMVFFVPSALTPLALLDALKDAQLEALKKVMFIGEPMPLATLRYLRKRLPHALLANQYGPTEITVAAICWTAGAALEELSDTPIGTPCANVVVILVDDEEAAITEDDQVGEILIGGPGVALGYWNDPEKTAERFFQNPCHDRFRDIVYRTGDLGYRSGKDGQYYLLGRKDSQFKYLGHRIEPGEIESAILALEGVLQCSVHYNAEEQRITAFAICSEELSLGQLRNRLGASIPAYMLPRALILRDTFPLTSNGKTDRRTLWSQYLESSQASSEKGS